MKFVTFLREGASEPGVLIDTDVVSLKGAGFATLVDAIAGGPAARARIGTWVLKPAASAVAPLASVRLLAPIPRPPKIICVGLNYRDHAIELYSPAGNHCGTLEFPSGVGLYLGHDGTMISTGPNDWCTATWWPHLLR